MTWRAGVDILSFGATKNGALSAEAVIFFNRDHVGALSSSASAAVISSRKCAFYRRNSAPMWPMAIGCATPPGQCRGGALAAGLANQPGVRIAEAVDGNICFCTWRRGSQALRDADIHFYVRGEGPTAGLSPGGDTLRHHGRGNRPLSPPSPAAADLIHRVSRAARAFNAISERISKAI